MSSSSKLNLKYSQSFATKHTRDYYRGRSFHYAGKWVDGVHYFSDDYNIDFVVHGQCLLACAKSHLSTLENEPIDYIKDSKGTITGIISVYWDFVLAGINGASPGIKIIDKYWYTCENVNLPISEQVWVNTGVKATFEFEDLTEEEIELLQKPARDFVDNFFTETVVQTTGQGTDKVISQKGVTDALEQEVIRSDNAYLAKDIYAFDTTANWDAKVGYIPPKGTIIVYTDHGSVIKDGVTVPVPGIKVGTGNAYVQDLAFVTDDFYAEFKNVLDELEEVTAAALNDLNDRVIQINYTLNGHIANAIMHTSASEKVYWNNKVSIDESAAALEILKFIK